MTTSQTATCRANLIDRFSLLLLVCGDGCGGPGQSPTADLRVRSALLYATELPGHAGVVYRGKSFRAKAGSSCPRS